MGRKRFIVNIKLLYGYLSRGRQRRARGTGGIQSCHGYFSGKERVANWQLPELALRRARKEASVGACSPEERVKWL